METVSKEEHQSSIGRVHSRIDGIDKSVARQEVIVDRIEKAQENFITKIEKVMYGNGRDGLITKVSNLIKDRWIIRAIMLSILGLAFYVIRKGV